MDFAKHVVLKLEHYGDFFGRSMLSRQLLFLALSLIIISISGYYIGTFDQAIHIPFLKKEVNPSLFPNDPFFELRKTHYSYFWFLFKPFLHLGILEISLFIVHLAATYLTFLAIWRIAKTLFENSFIAFLCVIIFVFPHLGFAAFPIFEFSLLNRTFVLPFLLFSIDLYLQKKYIQSFVLLGIMNNIHALSVNFVVFMFGVDLLFRFFRERWSMKKKGRIFAGVLGFVVASLPVLIWKFGKSPLDYTLRPDWFHILTSTLMQTVFYPLSTFPYVIFLSICGISSFFLYFAMTKYMKLSEKSESITHFMYAAIFLIGGEVIVSEWLPVTFLVQFQIVRIGIFALIFAYLYFIASIARKYKDAELSARQFLVQFVSVVLSITALVPLVVSFTSSFLPKRDRLVAEWVIIITSFVAFVALAWQTQVWRPGIHIFPQSSDWVTTQLWAKESTPLNAKFITPPEKWWLFESDWRVFSERSTVVTLDEVLEFAFTPEYTASWKSRFDTLAPGARERFNGDLFDSEATTKKAYDSLSTADFLRIAQMYEASYIVVEKPKSLDLPLVYENASFRVYKSTSVFIASSLPKS